MYSPVTALKPKAAFYVLYRRRLAYKTSEYLTN